MKVVFVVATVMALAGWLGMLFLPAAAYPLAFALIVLCATGSTGMMITSAVLQVTLFTTEGRSDSGVMYGIMSFLDKLIVGLIFLLIQQMYEEKDLIL